MTKKRYLERWKENSTRTIDPGLLARQKLTITGRVDNRRNWFLSSKGRKKAKRGRERRIEGEEALVGRGTWTKVEESGEGVIPGGRA